MCNTFNVESASKIRRLFEFLKNYQNCFDFKNTKTFFEYKNKITLLIWFPMRKHYMNRFIFFWNWARWIKKLFVEKFHSELYTKIYESCERIDAFRSQKNDNFLFCVNYKKLNVLIIKNRCSFSLIDKTLNRLVSAVYFIKLNFKNVYYRIKICKNDEWIIIFRIR